MLAAAPPRSRALLLAVLLGLHWVPTLLRAAPVRQPAAWGAWQQFEDEGMLAVMDRGPALVDHTNKGDKSAVSQWHCVSQLEQPELLLRQHEWDLNVGASVLVANTGCSSRLALLRAGFGRRVREATTRAVEIAQEARQQAQCDSPHSASCIRNTRAASCCRLCCRPHASRQPARTSMVRMNLSAAAIDISVS